MNYISDKPQGENAAQNADVRCKITFEVSVLVDRL